MKFSEYRYTVFYNKNNENELSILCDKYGSDKGSIDIYMVKITLGLHIRMLIFTTIFFPTVEIISPKFLSVE